MRKYIISVLMFFCVMAFAVEPITYEGCSPDSGSTIENWEFSLQFGIEEGLNSLPTGEYGIGRTGAQAKLYRGVIDDDHYLGKAWDGNLTGKTSDFVINGSTMKMSFDPEIPIINGENYFITIYGKFGLFATGKGTSTASYIYFDPNDPLILEYIGKSEDVNLDLVSVSIENNTCLSLINEIKYEWNCPIKLLNNSIEIRDQWNFSKVINLSVDDQNPNIVIAEFEGLELLYGHSYNITFPKGTVCVSDNDNCVNVDVNHKVFGATKYYFDVLSSTPNTNETGIFDKISIEFELPDGKFIHDKYSEYTKLGADLYIGTITDENRNRLIATKSSDGKTLTWTPAQQWLPNTTYYLIKGAEELVLSDSEDNIFPEWTNKNEIILSWTTPSIEDANFPKIEFSTPHMGKHDEVETEFIEGGTYVRIDEMEVALKDLTYPLESGSFYKGFSSLNNNGAFVYDTTSGEDVLVDNITCTIVTRETPVMYYQVMRILPRMNFFEGHSYKIVVPEGTFTAGPTSLKNYIKNDEIVYTFNGATPTEAKIQSCSIEGKELSNLYTISYKFDGVYNLIEELPILVFTNTDNGKSFQYTPASVSFVENGTSVLTIGVFNQYNNGKPLVPTPYGTGYGNYTVTLPANIIQYPTDETIVNKEYVAQFKWVEESTQEVKEPEFVNLDVTIGGIDHSSNFAAAHKTTIEAVKDRKATVSLVPDSNWEVVALTRDGNDVFDWIDNGSYTTPKLTADSHIVATIEYAGPEMTVDHTTGVSTVPESSISVYKDGGMLVVDGVSTSDSIHIYSVSGMLIKSITPQDGCDIVKVSVPQNQTYVVLVNEYATKIQF